MDTASIKFNNSFTELAETYIQDCQSKGFTPTLPGFAKLIGTDEETLWAWGNKKKKDEVTGEITEELARPKFNSVLKRIEKLQKAPVKEVKKEEKEKGDVIKLNPKQELFCQLYASDREFFGNGVQAYAEAYDLDLAVTKDYNNARIAASKFLTNSNILKRIDELLELGPLNDTFVDKQLAKVIAQDADFSSKVSAIREYNKLKQRITEKLELGGNITVNRVTNAPENE